MTDLFEKTFFNLIDERAEILEKELGATVVFYHGSILPQYFRIFRDFIEEVKSQYDSADAIAIVLRTAGGSAEATERMVTALRHNYSNVFFVVPDIALSAGTIFCMSGDRIYMDYASSLGPIDPQVPTPDTGHYVPALGYLDKVMEITQKGQLAPADVVLLKTLDLAKLALFEQARDLSIDLLKEWLVKYKFKDWTEHQTTNPGTPVTEEEKADRAEEIARDLNNHKRWRSHGRSLNIPKLKDLRIRINDYSDNAKLTSAIRGYNDPLTGYIDRAGTQFLLHNRKTELLEMRQ